MRTHALPAARFLVSLLLVALPSAGCQASPSTVIGTGQKARGVSIESLAGGQVASLPSGNVFLRVHSFVQDPNSAFPSSSHGAGFVYQEDGRQLFTAQGAAPVDLEAGTTPLQTTVTPPPTPTPGPPHHARPLSAPPPRMRLTHPRSPRA